MRVKIINDFKLNIKSITVNFFTLLLLSSLFVNTYAANNDEKIQNTEDKSKNAIDKELEYLSKGINYENTKSNHKVELVTKKVDAPKNTSEDNVINKKLEYSNKDINYKNNKSDHKVELVTKKVDAPKNISKDTAINKELAYLDKGINYKTSKSKLIGQIYLRTDLGFSKLQTNAYKDNFCIDNCNDKSHDSGKAYNFGIGWYINSDYRIDLLYNATSLKFDYDQQNKADIINYKHKVDVSTLMLNLYRYKSISKYFDLYIGGGVGYTRISPDNGIRTYDNDETDAFSAKPSNNFSYSLTTGTSLKITNNVELNLGYRFLDYGKVKGFDNLSLLNYQTSYNPVKSDSLRGHNFTLGIIYKLPKQP